MLQTATHNIHIHTYSESKDREIKQAQRRLTWRHKLSFHVQKHATEDEIIQSQTQLVLPLHGSTSTYTSGVAGGHVAHHGIAALSIRSIAHRCIVHTLHPNRTWSIPIRSLSRKEGKIHRGAQSVQRGYK
jgi:hypothetical protein